MLQGFRDFVMRGNVIDLAVAVVVGAAFTAVIAAFTENIINPVLAAFGGADAGGFGFCVRSAGEPCTADSATFIDIGAVVSVIVAFVITMAVVYFVFVLPVNKFRERGDAEQPGALVADDVALLTEIRDLLAAGQPESAPGADNPGRPVVGAADQAD